MDTYTIEGEGPILKGEHGGTWNGWAVPVVTAEAFTKWVDEWAAYAWIDGATVTEADGVLTYSAYGESTTWAARPDGRYAIDGFVWTREEVAA